MKTIAAYCAIAFASLVANALAQSESSKPPQTPLAACRQLSVAITIYTSDRLQAKDYIRTPYPKDIKELTIDGYLNPATFKAINNLISVSYTPPKKESSTHQTLFIATLNADPSIIFTATIGGTVTRNSNRR